MTSANSSMCHRLAGMTALVTGGTSGIGVEVVRRFAQEGARQVIVALPDEEHRALAIISSLPLDTAIFVGGDVARPETAQTAVDSCLTRFDRLDILVNCAGIDYSGTPLVESDLTFARRVMEVNFFGAFLMLREAARAMAAAGGSIVNIASRAAVVGIPTMSIYGASKAALVALTRAAALELAPATRVNAVAPGATATPMMQTWIDDHEDPLAFEASLVSSIPRGRLARPAEIADAVLFLASEESSYVTGAVLAVDGGYTTG